jgi:regulator of sigma E protease
MVPEDIPGWIEQPLFKGIPLSIPSIGVAFHILPEIMSVQPGSPAEKAGITKGTLKKIVLNNPPDAPAEKADPKATDKKPSNESQKLVTIDFEDAKGNYNNNCAYAFWNMQFFRNRKAIVTVAVDGQSKVVVLMPTPDRDWNLPILGVRLIGEPVIQKADSIEEAFRMSIHKTNDSVLNIYLTLRSLLTGRVSYMELHGPLGIANAAYQVAKNGLVQMLVFLSFLSVNLAVLNFLPIPVLDGGHMVFLITEAITRKKPSERLVNGASFAGLAFLVCLMALVLFLDIFVHPFAEK